MSPVCLALVQVLLSWISLFTDDVDPNPDGIHIFGAMPEIEHLFKTNRPLHDKMAAEWTRKYACGDGDAASAGAVGAGGAGAAGGGLKVVLPPAVKASAADPGGSFVFLSYT
jgi:hypothetical protein